VLWIRNEQTNKRMDGCEIMPWKGGWGRHGWLVGWAKERLGIVKDVILHIIFFFIVHYS
jgi:hypothetical protein